VIGLHFLLAATVMKLLVVRRENTPTMSVVATSMDLGGPKINKHRVLVGVFAPALLGNARFWVLPPPETGEQAAANRA